MQWTILAAEAMLHDGPVIPPGICRIPPTVPLIPIPGGGRAPEMELAP